MGHGRDLKHAKPNDWFWVNTLSLVYDKIKISLLKDSRIIKQLKRQ